MDEGIEILVRALRFPIRKPPAGGQPLAGPGAYVAVAGAGVVHPDPLAATPSEELVERPVDRLAEEIPECEFNRRVSARLDPAAAKAEVTDHGPGVAIDLERVLPQQVRRNGLVNVSLDRLSAIERFPEPDEPFVGMDPYPEEIGELAKPDSLDRRDFHPTPRSSRPAPSRRRTHRVIR